MSEILVVYEQPHPYYELDVTRQYSPRERALVHKFSNFHICPTLFNFFNHQLIKTLPFKFTYDTNGRYIDYQIYIKALNIEIMNSKEDTFNREVERKRPILS